MRPRLWPLLLLLLMGCASPKAEPEPELQPQSVHAPGGPWTETGLPVTVQTEPMPIAKQMAGVTGIQQVVVNDQGFRPAVLSVGLGERVKIHLVNQGEREHTLTLPRWGVFIQKLRPGGETYIEFTASEKGVWKFYSDTSGEPEPTLTGQLVVE